MLSLEGVHSPAVSLWLFVH